MPFSSWMRNLWTDDSVRMPEKDEKMMLADSIMMELEFSMKEFERYQRQREQNDKKRRSSVDYSWLVSSSEKPSVQIPQLERFELESLCQQIKGTECCKVIVSFRSRVGAEPPLEEFPRIMRSCIIRAIDERPKVETIGDWVSRRRSSFTNFKLRTSSKVAPATSERGDDVEMQNSSAANDDFPAMGTTISYAQETSRVM